MGFWKMVEWLASFDVITPTVAIAKDVAAGPTVGLRMATGGMSARKVEKYLKKKGVPCWGFMNVPGAGAIRFSVPAGYAIQARRLLNKKGVPLR